MAKLLLLDLSSPDVWATVDIPANLDREFGYEEFWQYLPFANNQVQTVAGMV